MVDRKLVEAPSNFIAGRLKAALLFCLLLLVLFFLSFYFLARFIVVVLLCLFALYVIQALWLPAFQFQLPAYFMAGRPKAALLFCLLLLVLFFLSFYFLARFIVVVLLCLFDLHVILALWPPAFQFQPPALFFVCVLFVLFLLFVVVLSGELKQNQGRGLVDRKLVQASPLTSAVILMLAVPRRLFCFGSLVILVVMCCYLLFFLLYINIEMGENRC